MVDKGLRRVLLRYLASGLILEHEAAYLAATTKQAVHNWVRAAGIDVKAARAKRVWWLANKIRAEVHGRPMPRPRRAKGRWIYHGEDELGARKRG